MKIRRKSGRIGSSFAVFSRLPQQGFTYLELVFVIIIISTLVSMLLVRVMPAIDEAERAAVLKIEGQLRSSLTMEAARYVARGEFERIRGMVGMNPMRLMMDPPANYVGERDTTDGVPRAHWVFATESGRLVYRPDVPRTKALAGLEQFAPEFAVQLAYEDMDGDGRYTARDGQYYGVRLARVKGAGWLDRESLLDSF